MRLSSLDFREGAFKFVDFVDFLLTPKSQHFDRYNPYYYSIIKDLLYNIWFVDFVDCVGHGDSNVGGIGDIVNKSTNTQKKAKKLLYRAETGILSIRMLTFC